MYKGKKIIVVLPAYNAGKTLKQTYDEIDLNLVDDNIFVGDASKDDTLEQANAIGIKHVVKHTANKGYGCNQKSCYNKALELNADIVVMLHPDYQYTPLLLPAMISIIGNDLYQVVFGSRILGKGALRGEMPYYKFLANKILTGFQNIMLRQKLSEYHTSYRSFSAEVLRNVPYNNNSDDFVFDNEMIGQMFYAGYEIAEVTCPTKYFEEASSINFSRSVKYGIGVLRVCYQYRLQKLGLIKTNYLK